MSVSELRGRLELGAMNRAVGFPDGGEGLKR